MNDGVELFIVDAFTNEPFRGNPAAVCLSDKDREESWMQQVAAEMNLSETAYVVPAGAGFGSNDYRLRWFTPKAEVDLCGHATLAAAHQLWQTGRLPADAHARFHTKSGLLTAWRDGAWIAMDFPAEPPAAEQVPEELIQALGLIPRFAGRNRIDYFIEVDNEQTVRTLKPDFAMIARLQARGVVVTSRADADSGADYDFVSRAFYPAIGVNEDPVTGSAHCALAPYWSKRLRKDELIGYQASERGGIVRVKPGGDRVCLSGQAITVLKGQLEG
ncbi:PhzF family phenazine biosynthesis protein [Paenibacillus harenae]|uniref:PhzF family phenazine biosynthesis protein n=1 Tax=Paenibacillus harenae TaxID=306543 RepID=UPI00278E92CC|nr:PhzF family phenazine biosynthesis protein [Paenibacillus harenae]MDQ0059260.1 PhzF family phenazine biosynthesis protein [Paenibacillus harenae]